jgi:hypothetical protein
MKTQVIRLDTHDDLISVRDKMSWAKAERILLVFPRRSRILSRILDLRLLERHATSLGAQLAIVANSDELRRSAQGVDIPAFKTTDFAQRQAWEKEEFQARPINHFVHTDLRQMRRDAPSPMEAPWRSIYGFRFLFFSLGVLAILAVFSLFIPSATISLNPATRLQSLTFSIKASPNVNAIDLTGSVPARLTSLVIEQSGTVPTSGSATIPGERSQGLARFRNMTTSQVIIPSGTIVSTQTSPMIRFATTVDAVVPAGLNKTTDVPIQAVVGGPACNLPSEMLIAIEGDLGVSLAVTNPNPMTGGSNRTAAIQTPKDRSLIYGTLLAEILNECKTSLNKALMVGDIYFPDTLAVSEIISETYFPAESQSGDTLSLTLRVRCQARYALFTDVNGMAVKLLDVNLPVGYIPSPDNLALLPASTPITDTEGITRWDVHVQRLLRASIEPLIAVQQSLGHRPAVAVLRLNEILPLSRLPIIQVNPSWWPWMPAIPFRITVTSGE